MVNVRKVSAHIDLEFTYQLFGYTPIINGSMTIHQGRGRKKLQINFVWNMGASTYPTIKGMPYDAVQVEQLASMLNFYTKFIEPDKI